MPFLELASWALAGGYAVSAVAHAGGAASRGPAVVAASAASAFSVAALAVAATRSHRDSVRVGLARAVGMVALVHALLRFAIDPVPGQTGHLLLTLVGLAAFLTARTYLVFAAIGWLGWMRTIPSGTPPDGWGQQAYLLLTATGLGVVLMLGRLYRELERERAGVVEEGLNRDLAVSLSWYKALFDQSPALMCIHDQVGRIEDVNPAGLESLGYSRQAVVGQSILDFMVPVAAGGPAGYLEEVVREGRADGFLRARAADGHVRIWEYRSTLLRAGSDVQILATATDVTELTRAQDAVARLSESDPTTESP